MTDQINSSRIITNDSGNVVFSEAYGPYGDVQKTWVNTYDPKLKFSGKEREGYSDLDYFGARYYDHKSYRFNSVDPVISKAEALINPQLWNLYAYCRNNPVTYFDPDGRLYAKINLIEHKVKNTNEIPDNPKGRHGATIPKIKEFEAKILHSNGKYQVDFTFEVDVHIWYLQNVKNHEWRHAKDMLIGFRGVLNILRAIEQMSFDNLNDLKAWIEWAKRQVLYNMRSAVNSSAIKRDYLFSLGDETESFIEGIFGPRLGENKERSIIWDERKK